MSDITFGPCATEDSSWCYWNAPTMGNGGGISFIALGPADPAPEHVEIAGCQPGTGLPAVDQTPEGVWWAYCEPALGNAAPEPVVEPVVEVPPAVVNEHPVIPTVGITQLPATGLDDVSPGILLVGLALVVAGLATTLRAARR